MSKSAHQNAAVRWRILADLTVRDFQQQYRGTYLGFVWTFFQPLLFFGVLYLVFAFGLRAQDAVDMPFALYLVCGMVCWSFVAGNLTSITGVVKAHSYLVRKVDVDLEMLPLVKVFSSLVPHAFLVAFAVGVAWWHDYGPTWYTLQVIYYLVSMMALLVGLGWLTSSTSLFVRDVGNVVSVVTQFGFWLTPIFWNIAVLPERFQWLIKANPVTYLVTGYRDSIVSGVPFWDRGQETLYYWGFTSASLLIGYRVFRRLRPHFAEVV